MKNFLIFALVGLVVAAPSSKETEDDGKFMITKDLFIDDFKVHTAEHEIVSLLLPLNALNADDDAENYISDETDDESTIFFVEADVNNGVKEYKGLSVLRNKQVKKILKTGTDAAAAIDNTKLVYFGATDGLYVYNANDNTAEKYGPFTDSIISIVKVNGSDEIYILTIENELYRVTEEGFKKELVNEVVGAQQIVLDYSNNLYYYDADKKLYVYTEGAVKEFEGLPSEPSYIHLLRAPFFVEDGVVVVLDDKAYIIYANGNSELADFGFVEKPSAYAMEVVFVQFYAYEKGIYMFNIFSDEFSALLAEMRNVSDNLGNKVQVIASRSRSNRIS